MLARHSAERLNNGRELSCRRIARSCSVIIRRHRRPGPLVGPTLAAQFGYLPGTLWILVGRCWGGCVQDMIILLLLHAP